MKNFCGNNCYIIGPTGPTGPTGATGPTLDNNYALFLNQNQALLLQKILYV